MTVDDLIDYIIVTFLIIGIVVFILGAGAEMYFYESQDTWLLSKCAEYF